MVPPTVSVWRWAAFAQSLAATFGSLYFSYGLGLPACILCLFQRTLMVSLLVLTVVGISRPKPNLIWYAAPFALLGAGLGLYQHLLQIGVLGPAAGVCSTLAVSCSERYGWDGFFTIPLLSALAFLIILGALLLDRRQLTASLSPDR